MRSDDFLTLDPAGMPVLELHPYLLGTVAPRPIALASTVDAEGRPNLAPFSYFNVFSAAPPVLVFSPARRGRDNTTKHTLENVLAVPEVVIHLVDYALVGQSSLASSDFPEGVNEIEMAGLTALPSECVRPPRVAEAPVAFECRVDRVEALGAGRARGIWSCARSCGSTCGAMCWAQMGGRVRSCSIWWAGVEARPTCGPAERRCLSGPNPARDRAWGSVRCQRTSG